MVLLGLVSDLFHPHLTSPNGASECTTLHVISQVIKVRSPSYQRKKKFSSDYQILQTNENRKMAYPDKI